MPAVHTSVSGRSRPELASCSGVKGPWDWPASAIHQADGGRRRRRLRRAACARPSRSGDAIAMPMPTPTPAPARPPAGFAAATGIELPELVGLVRRSVADHVHAGARVERLLHLGGHRDVHDVELRDLEPVLVVDARAHQIAEPIRERLVVLREVEQRDLGLRDQIGEGGRDDRAQQLPDLVGLEGRVGADELFEQALGVERAQRVGAEGAHAQRAEIGVAQQHRGRRAPLEVRDQPGADEVDLGLEGAVEAVGPARERREHGQVAGLEPVLARREDVGELALAHEDGELARAHDQLRSILDLVVVAREAPHERVSTVVDPFDDVDELGAQLVQQSHLGFLLALLSREAA